MRSALDDASVGRFGTNNSASTSERKYSHPKSHGVAVPRVGVPGGANPVAVPKYRAGIKPHSSIIRDVPGRELWNGTQTVKGRDGDAEKERLANAMSRQSAGRTAEERIKETGILELQHAQELARTEKQKERQRMQHASADALYDEISKEIDERWEFLETMTRAGKGDEHKPRVMGEIAQRVATMKRLDVMIREEEQRAQGY